MFGIDFPEHPNLKRLLMPVEWQGHPLRKSYVGRVTEMAPYTIHDAENLNPARGKTISKIGTMMSILS